MRLSIEDEAVEWHRGFVQAKQIRVFEGFRKEEARKTMSGQVGTGVQYIEGRRTYLGMPVSIRLRFSVANTETRLA